MNQDRVVQEDERLGSICGGVGGVVFFSGGYGGWDMMWVVAVFFWLMRDR